MKFNLALADKSNIELRNDVALRTQNFPIAFATSEDFVASIISVFGDRIDEEKVESLRQQWLAGSFGGLPIVEIRPAAEINGASGAYSSDTNKIHLLPK